MKGNKQMKTISHIIYAAFALFTFTCFAPLQNAQAVSPPPDGGYANENTAEGKDALLNLTSVGCCNTAIGFNALLSDTTGGGNTAIGSVALPANTAGSDNTATGFEALFYNTTGSANTATGQSAMVSNTTGWENTATGVEALYSNTTGINNTATGVQALHSNTTGSFNTATGQGALFSNTTGSDNTADGLEALLSNTTGIGDAAMGVSALRFNTTGSLNTATGAKALRNNTTGSNNTANGNLALENNTTGGNNIALGFQAGINLTMGSNNIDIGNLGVAGEANTIRIGEPTAVTDPVFGERLPAHTATFIAGIYGKTASGGTAVYINSSGRLGTLTSSARFKQDIHSMDKASEAILKLKPVTFHYKQELDPEGIPQFGLVAEEVEKVNPDLVARDNQGKPYTVRYDAVNAMLLNEFLKEHRKVEEQSRKIQEQDATITQFKKEMQTIVARLKEQDSKIQKVSARLEMQKPSAQTVANNQ